MNLADPQQPDFRSVVPIELAKREAKNRNSVFAAEEFEVYLDRAVSYLQAQRWSGRVGETHVGYLEPGIVGVFLFHLPERSEEVDPWIWVVVGDLPSAYIPCFEINSPRAALDGYAFEMERWASAVSEGRSTRGLYPVGVPEDDALAADLTSRMVLLRERVLPKVPGGE
jgi:hypothetical protein